MILKDIAYGSDVYVLDILNLEMAFADSEISNTELNLFGLDAMSVLELYLQECYGAKEGIANKLIKRMFSNMQKREAYGVDLISDLEQFFANACISQ